MGAGKLDDALDFLLLLGLRNPTESALKVLVLSILCAPHCSDNAIGAAQETKLALTKTVRTLFRQRAKQYLEPAVWLQTLPQLPAELRDLHPTVYATAYVGKEPAPCPASTMQMEQLKQGTRSRVVRKASVIDLGSLQSSQQMAVPPQFVQFGQNLMVQMQAMQQQLAALSSSPAALPSNGLIDASPQAKNTFLLRLVAAAAAAATTDCLRNRRRTTACSQGRGRQTRSE